MKAAEQKAQAVVDAVRNLIDHRTITINPNATDGEEARLLSALIELVSPFSDPEPFRRGGNT